MKFRLYYEGELRPTQREALEHQRDSLAIHKHDIRRKFHVQLKQLWKTNRFLKEYRRHPDGDISERSASDAGMFLDYDDQQKIPLWQYIASQKQYQRYGYSFVPLVRDEISLLCSLDILFLRRDIPGSVIQAGDIDNRIKTLIDALRVPNSPNEIASADETPQPDETPFYCLLWDDKQVSHFSVVTDTLLDPPLDKGADSKKVRLIITVELQPYHVTMFNLSFAGS